MSTSADQGDGSTAAAESHKRVSTSREQMSSEAVSAATGKTWEQWFELLDGQGAVSWSHQKIARWLDSETDMGGWWAQGITIGYEQEHGLRIPGQRSDGTFGVSATKTVVGSPVELFDTVMDQLEAAIGEAPVSKTLESRFPKARWNSGNGEAIVAILTDTGDGKTRVAVELQKLTDPERVTAEKARIKALLGTVRFPG